MNKNYIDVPTFTTLNEIMEKDFTLSATQYKTFFVKNNNLLLVSDFLDRKINRNDLGYEVGSDSYVEKSDYQFIKTKALQEETFLLDLSKEALQCITPSSFINMNLKNGDIIISKDSNVGEVVILDRDYPNAMLCGGIYKLPISKNKYYLLAFIKSDVFRQQIDFLVPRGSTIRHGKTKFLDCKIPIPNKNNKDTIEYVELLMQAIINKEILIRYKHQQILNEIHNELLENQKEVLFKYSLPTLNEIIELDRMDGTSSIEALGFKISRGQNLQISNIGKSVQSKKKIIGYYKLILPKFLSKYGTVNEIEYLGNNNKLKTLEVGDIIFGAEGNEKGRSLAIIENQELSITNIHGITLKQEVHNVDRGIFVKLFLDYLRDKGMIDAYAVGGNGGSLAIKYWDFLKFPNFTTEKIEEIVKLYHNPDLEYEPSKCNLDNFINYDKSFNETAGIYELDKSMKQLKDKLNKAIDDITNDIEVIIDFSV